MKAPVPATVRAAVESLLATPEEDSSPELVVLVRDTGPTGEHLLLWRNGFLYADFRNLNPDFGNLIDAGHLTRISRLGSHSTGFAPTFKRGQLCGQSIDIAGHEVVVAVKQQPGPSFAGLVLW